MNWVFGELSFGELLVGELSLCELSFGDSIIDNTS